MNKSGAQDENATLVLVSKIYSIVYMIAQKSNPRFKLELFMSRREIGFMFERSILANYVKQNSSIVLKYFAPMG